MFGRRRYYLHGVGTRNAHIAVLLDAVEEDYKASAAFINSGDKLTSQCAWTKVSKLDRAQDAGYVKALLSVKERIRSHRPGEIVTVQDVEKFIDDELFDVNSHLESSFPFDGIEVNDIDFSTPPPLSQRDINDDYVVMNEQDEVITRE